MSYQCVTCCEVSITKVGLFEYKIVKLTMCECNDPVEVSLHDALVVESMQVIYISGSIEFPDKSYNSFVVSGDF
jgi:hypothetical protein